MQRHITLLIEKATKEDIDHLKSYCNTHKLDFRYRYGKEWKGASLIESYGKDIAPLYYFTITGDTKDFERLNKEMNERLILTEFAEIGNIADSDDAFIENLRDLINVLDESIKIEHKANRALLDFVMPITDVLVLNALKSYSGHMSDFQKKILEDRITICSGEREKIDEEMEEMVYALNSDVKELRLKTGMNRKEFATYFKIPYRTVEDWENKKSTCSSYLYKLMEEKLIREGKINN